tara:strand:+ start:560 stop:1714 length:1155 start_codon:yes stop_codon:yes gene_type:complete
MAKKNKKLKKVFMFVNVDWFFFSHRLAIAKAARPNQFRMSVYTDLTNSEKSNQKREFDLFQSPISRSSKNKILLILEFLKVFLLILKKKPDLIHAVTIKPIILLGIISRLTKTPFIGAISGLGPVFSAQTFFSNIRLKIVLLIYRFIFKPKYSTVICQNKHDKKIFIDLKIATVSKITISPGSGVDLDRFKPIESHSQKRNVLMASRILSDKGVYEYCAAAKSLNSGEGNIEFKLAGPIDELSPSAISLKELESLCENSGVEYLGNRNDLNTLLPLASIFVLPSYYAEGMPKVLLEAASCGIPVITTNHPGCRDAIINNKTGILIESRNSKSIELAILKLLNDTDLMIKMGKAGRKLAEKNYDERKVIDLHYHLYRYLTKKAFN